MSDRLCNVSVIPSSETNDFQAHIVANGKVILKFYDDEISFTAAEIEGKTEKEIQELFLKKDSDFLRS